MEFKNVNVELPGQHLKPHLNWLWVQTEKYVPMAAFLSKVIDRDILYEVFK